MIDKAFIDKYLEGLKECVKDASNAILEVYESSDFGETNKQDGSPLTIADKNANEIILNRLNLLTPDIPIISEETFEVESLQSLNETYWLVDPLDGTKEFIKKNGEFTVNIAFINEGYTKIGFINAPAKNKIFFNDEKKSYIIETESKDEISIKKAKQIKVSDQKQKNLIATISRSHSGKEIDNYLKDYDIEKINYVGSSYKFCLIASGEAHIYPRMSPTCEWDTAAGHAILKTAGGNVTLLNGEELRYGFKENNFINPNFIARN